MNDLAGPARWTLISAALLGALAVLFGAFGAHALQGVLTVRAQAWYDTAVTYHSTHALALLGCGLFALHESTLRMAAPRVLSALRVAAILFIAGIALFAGSLYLMAFTGNTRLGMITPLGGVALISGWLSLALAALRLPSSAS